MSHLDSLFVVLFVAGAGVACLWGSSGVEGHPVEAQLWRVVRIVQGDVSTDFNPAGSGFILVRRGRPYVVTNAHVVVRSTRPLAVVYEDSAWPATHLSSDADWDVALLATSLPLPAFQSQERAAQATVGQALFAAGFPDTVGENHKVVTMHGRVIWRGLFSMESGRPVEPGDRAGNGVDAFVLDAQGCSSGWSGAPVFDATGALVGYIKGSMNQGRCFGVAISRALALLDEVAPG